MARTKRTDRLSFLHPSTRFFWGLGMLGCLVFAAGWEARGLLCATGALLAVLSGKRVSFPYFAFLIATIVLFHLFLPIGRIWVQVGPWPVTEGAFFLGLGKGFTFAGLVFFSLASISRDLRLPGRFGALWGKTFSWYEQLMDQRKAIKPRALILSIDLVLERLYPTRPNSAPTPTNHPQTSAATTAGGWSFVVLTLALGVATLVFLR